MDIISTIVPLVIIIIIFFFIVRVATAILKLTGLDENTARFQAISAFTGTGFTTREAELILDDPIRRRTVTVLMILGKVGIVSIIAGFFLSFGKNSIFSDLGKALILIIVILVLYRLTTLRGFSRTINRFIENRIVARGLIKQKTLEELFSLPRGYGIAKLMVTKESKEKGLTLQEAGFISKNILVLCIERKNNIIPFPHADDELKEGDSLLCYGLISNIKSYEPKK